MKISVISDCHLGFDFGGERGDDPFLLAEEAIEKSSDCDIILLTGDIFDSRVPKPEVLYRAIEIFSKVKRSKKKVLRIIKGFKKTSKRTKGTQIIAIHGTHERRTKEFVNPIQMLSKMNLLSYLHGNYMIFENVLDEKDRVAIHGMSAVPEVYASEMLKKFNFKPIKGCYNILMLHQSIEGFVYGEENLKIEDLPDGFDLIVNGHIHWHIPLNKNLKNLIFPGSTVCTQIKKIEAEIPKGFLKIDTKTKKIEFIVLERQRKVFYKEFLFDNISAEECSEKIDSFMQSLNLEEFKIKPIVKIKVSEVKNPDFIAKKWRDKAILEISRVSSESRLEFKNLELFGERKSIHEMGMEILAKNLGKEKVEGLNISDFFDYLVQGELDLAKKSILGQYDNKIEN